MTEQHTYQRPTADEVADADKMMYQVQVWKHRPVESMAEREASRELVLAIQSTIGSIRDRFGNGPDAVMMWLEEADDRCQQWRESPEYVIEMHTEHSDGFLLTEA